jgi:MotA/TolQ/ExbB proton channel family protein
MAIQDTADVPLPWARRDIEQRLFFRGGRHTHANPVLAGLLGFIATVVFYAALVVPELMKQDEPEKEKAAKSAMYVMFAGGEWAPPAIVFLSFWSLALLLLKARKLKFQRRALRYDIVPRDVDFVLSAANVDQINDRIYSIVDDPKHFVLYNRIVVALSNLKNLGRVGDLDEILNSQAENDEAASETSYVLVNGFIWAIPVLGFTGTVLGLSKSMGDFGLVLKGGGGAVDMTTIREGLLKVTGSLGGAFSTTLIALVAALVIQLFLTFIKVSEQEFLDECGRYCTSQIVNRLRIVPFKY